MEEEQEESHELLLPLIDEENICLPLPINVVSRYWNVELPMLEAMDAAKKYSGFGGSIIIEGIELAERHGLTCKIANSSLDELKRVIDLGIPPIVILPGIPEITQHASVITGFNDRKKTVLHYIQKGNERGEQQEGVIPQNVFEKEWSEEGRLLIVISPPDVMSSVKLDDDPSIKANRLCLISERLNILKRFSDAAESLKQAIRLDPENPTALHLLGTMLNEQNSSECIKFYERCLKINDGSYLTYNGLGNYYLKAGRFEEAERYYTKAVGVNPKRSAKIYKNRAYIREKQGDNSGAREDLKHYLKYFPRALDRGIIEKAIREL